MASVVPNDHTARADMLTTSAPRPDVELLFEDDVTSVCSDEVVAAPGTMAAGPPRRATPTSVHDHTHAVHTHRMGALWMCPHGLRHAECDQCATLPTATAHPAAAAARGNVPPNAAVRPAPSTRPSSRRNLPRTNTAPFKHLPKHEQARLASDAKETRKQEMATEAYHLERAKTKKAKEWAAEAAGGAGDTVLDASRTSSSINSHQDQWTTAVTKAAAHRSEQRRPCRGCRAWWRSSAGGKSGVVSIVLAVIIVLYAALIVALPALTDAVVKAETGIRNAAEVLFQVTTYVKVIVGSISMLLIFFGAWTIRRATCARESTLEDIAKTAEARRDSKWFAIRVFELIQEEKGPNSP